MRSLPLNPRSAAMSSTCSVHALLNRPRSNLKHVYRQHIKQAHRNAHHTPPLTGLESAAIARIALINATDNESDHRIEDP